MTTDIVEYKPTEAAIADIQRFKGLVVDVTTATGLASGKDALRQVAAVRIALEKTRKALKEDVLERGRKIDGEAKPLFLRVAEVEDPIKAQIDAEENRAERERQAAIEAEQKRLADEEAARKRKEQEELDAQRAEVARQAAANKAEQDRLQEEDRKRRQALAAEEDAARRRIEEQNRAAATAREEADRKAAEARRVDEERVAEERRKLRAEQDAKEAAERKVREEAEAKAAAERRAKEEAEREEKRKADELLDADHMLEVFIEKYHHLKRYAPVVRAIKELPAAKQAKKAA